LINQTTQILTDDECDAKLIANVRPTNWINPKPRGKYDLVVIGAGTAGLVTAAGAAGLGAKVALIERRLMGGDCLNYGCVPSKAIIRSSKAYADSSAANAFGVDLDCPADVDFAKTMGRMRRLRSEISSNDSVKRFAELGVDVFLGSGKFVSSNVVEVDGLKLPFKKAVIATGSRAFIPSIEGLHDAGFLTNETIFNLTKRPGRLAIIGGGPIGCEIAQAFGRLGCEIFLIHSGSHILNREDGDAAEIIQKKFIDEGITLILNATTEKVSIAPDGKSIHYRSDGTPGTITVDEILIGAGRSPNVEGLGLDLADVSYDDRRGVMVDDTLRTTNKKIYAAGDICFKYKFTHTADATARIVIQNALFFGRKKSSGLIVPWCTYTDPEIAHVGLYPNTSKVDLDTYSINFSEVDRARLDGEEDGFVKIHLNRGTDRIAGATIVCRHAGDMISEISVAMRGNVGLKTIAETIHPYPTQSEAIKKVADLYNKQRLTPFLKRVLKFLIKLH
jgi:pyruvate/2-oxoglutarate dehydrogenase complex dihydrolipoamide dehydrogenase (E3) component